jgi:hypothetical protein
MTSTERAMQVTHAGVPVQALITVVKQAMKRAGVSERYAKLPRADPLTCSDAGEMLGFA